MEFKDWLQKKLDEHGISQTKLAKAINENQPTIQRILSGETKNPRYKLTKKIESYFSSFEQKGMAVFFQETSESRDVKLPAFVKANAKQEVAEYGNNKTYPRVIGAAMMGDKGYYYDLEGGDGYLEVQAAKGAIAIKVRGDSMYPAIRDGWYVIVEPDNSPNIGEYVLVSFIDGKKMVKELMQIKDDCYILLSLNENKRITAMKKEIDQFQAISAVVAPSKHRDYL